MIPKIKYIQLVLNLWFILYNDSQNFIPLVKWITHSFLLSNCVYVTGARSTELRIVQKFKLIWNLWGSKRNNNECRHILKAYIIYFTQTYKMILVFIYFFLFNFFFWWFNILWSACILFCTIFDPMIIWSLFCWEKTNSVSKSVRVQFFVILYNYYLMQDR